MEIESFEFVDVLGRAERLYGYVVLVLGLLELVDSLLEVSDVQFELRTQWLLHLSVQWM